MTAKVSTTASSQVTANSTSRHSTPTRTKAGGNSARIGGSAPSRGGAARKREAKHAKGQPIGRRYQQEHAGRARRDRIDQRPEHRHHRRLPVTQSVLCDVLVNELGIVRHDAGIKDQQRQTESRSGQAGGNEPAALCLLRLRRALHRCPRNWPNAAAPPARRPSHRRRPIAHGSAPGFRQAHC